MEVNFKSILENNEDLTIHGEGLTDGDTFVFKDEPTKIYMIADGESQIFNIETGETFTLQKKDYEKPINIIYGKFQIISVQRQRGDNMLKKGTRVKIVDKHLKSNGRLGTFVGLNSQDYYKIYLDEPIRKKVYLVTLRDMESFEIAWEEMETDVAKAECFEWVKNRVSSLTSQLDAVTRAVKRLNRE